MHYDWPSNFWKNLVMVKRFGQRYLNHKFLPFSLSPQGRG